MSSPKHAKVFLSHTVNLNSSENLSYAISNLMDLLFFQSGMVRRDY